MKHVIMPTGMAAITIPASHKEAMASLYCERWKQAEECEIDTLESMGTYDWLYVRDMPTGEKLYRSKWAYDCKTVDGVLEKFKARLCCVGIEQREGSYEAVFSNCVRYASIRCLSAPDARSQCPVGYSQPPSLLAHPPSVPRMDCTLTLAHTPLRCHRS